MSAEDRVIALRALNFLRSVHVPTYVALRFLLDTSPQADESSMITSMVERLSFSETQRIYSVKRFKQIGPHGTAEYRNYSVPSPTHALAEAYALFHLQRVGLRDKDDFVYSYRPPSSWYYGRNYEHFSASYGKRNADVRRALSNGDVAIVCDLKKFYPSVNARHVVEKLVAAAADTKLERPQLRVIHKCLEACIQPGELGLRVGPDLTHTLADWALNDVDGRLSVQFPARYFRYVDDLVVTVPKPEVESASKIIRDIVNSAGFKLNEQKDAVATYEEWSRYINPYAHGNGSIDPLSAFKFRLKVFLARNPEMIVGVKNELNLLGIFLPFEALAEATSAATWREKIAQLWRSDWIVLVRYHFDSMQDIIKNAKECQNLIREDVKTLLSRKVELSGLSRRWHIQHARFLINRALYFLQDEDIAVLVDFMKEIPELDETAAVSTAISKGDFSRVAVMPGPTASAAAQLARLRGVRPEAGFPWNIQADQMVAADIAATFGVRGFQLNIESLNWIDMSDSSSLLRFAFKQERVPLEIDSVSYGSEMEALGSGSSYQAREQAAESRLLPDEEVVLDALALGSAYASG